MKDAPPPPFDKDEADRVLNAALVVQIVVVFVAALIAFATGVQALYVGKEWGTTWDFIAAIAWGMVARRSSPRWRRHSMTCGG